MTLEFSNARFKVDTQGRDRKETGKIWVSLIAGQPKAVKAMKPWTKQMRSSAVRDGILSEARVGTLLEKAPVRLQAFCVLFASPTVMKNGFDRGLLLVSFSSSDVVALDSPKAADAASKCRKLSEIKLSDSVPLPTPALPRDLLSERSFLPSSWHSILILN